MAYMMAIGMSFNNFQWQAAMADTNKRDAKQLSDAARRALAEAKARRAGRVVRPLAKERNGAKGPEPTRFGDWEKNGIASDF